MSTAQLLLVETESLVGSDVATESATKRTTSRIRSNISQRYLLDQTTLNNGRQGIATARAILAEAAEKRSVEVQLQALAA